MPAGGSLFFAVLVPCLVVWSVEGQGYLPRPGVILSASSKPAGVLGLRQLYSQSKKWKGNYKANPKSACSIAGSGSLCASAGTTDADANEQILQLMIATSPAGYSSREPSDTQVRLLSPPDDQQDCNTCTAFAVRAAAEAAVASVLQVDANRVSLSIQSLYYCGDSSGPMQECKSGSTLEAALQQLQARGHNLPTDRCLPYQGSEDPTVPATRESLCTPLCNAVSDLVQKGRFTYKRITNMWKAQQHIRTYGAVVTRFDVYDDLRPFFDIFSNVQKIYKPGPSAKFKEGHAVALVGYDNDQEFWVVKNSWGPAFGDEGYFKVAFNACSVLTEDGIDAYGIIWEPVQGTPVTSVVVLKVWAGPQPRCYWYLAQPGDYLSKVAWVAGVSLVKLMLDNTDYVTDLDAPLAGTLLRICQPKIGRVDVLPGPAPPPKISKPPISPASPPQKSPGPVTPPATPVPTTTTSTPTEVQLETNPGTAVPGILPAKSQDKLCKWSTTEKHCKVVGEVAHWSIKDQPTTLWHKYNLMRFDRLIFCQTFSSSQAACEAQIPKYRCYWAKDTDTGKYGCWSSDSDEGSMLSDKPINTPYAITCAGSKARDYLKCMSFWSTELCDRIPGCDQFGPANNRACYATWYYDLDSKAADKFIGDLHAVKPEVWGTCEGACFVQQAKICNNTGTTKGACMKHEFCDWNEGTRKCTNSLWHGSDSFSRQLQASADECAAYTTEAACLQKSVPLVHYGKWMDWTGPPAANYQCDVQAPPAPPAATSAVPAPKVQQEVAAAGGSKPVTAAGPTASLPPKAKDKLCRWSAASKLCEVRGVNSHWSINHQPATVWHKFNLFRYDRSVYCGMFNTSQAACEAQTANYRCFWDKDSETGKYACWSSDFHESWYDNTKPLENPYGITCVGSKARDYLKCMSAYKNSMCGHIPGCALFGSESRRACYSTWYYDMEVKTADQFIKDLNSVKPEIWGTCEGACFVQQAKICNTTGTTKGACMRHAFCTWDDDAKTCIISLWEGSDEFSRQLQANTDECATYTTEAACLQKEVAMVNYGKWLNWPGPSTANYQCDTN